MDFKNVVTHIAFKRQNKQLFIVFVSHSAMSHHVKHFASALNIII